MINFTGDKNTHNTMNLSLREQQKNDNVGTHSFDEKKEFLVFFIDKLGMVIVHGFLFLYSVQTKAKTENTLVNNNKMYGIFC